MLMRKSPEAFANFKEAADQREKPGGVSSSVQENAALRNKINGKLSAFVIVLYHLDFQFLINVSQKCLKNSPSVKSWPTLLRVDFFLGKRQLDRDDRSVVVVATEGLVGNLFFVDCGQDADFSAVDKIFIFESRNDNSIRILRTAFSFLLNVAPHQRIGDFQSNFFAFFVNVEVTNISSFKKSSLRSPILLA